MGAPVAMVRDPGTVDLNLASLNSSPSRTLAKIDDKSGTIVFGEDVTISRVAIAQGNISIKVTESRVVSQPNPFAAGESIVLPRSKIEITQTGDGNIVEVDPNTTLSELVKGLNTLGVAPPEMADIIRAMSTAGAIHAELIVK